MFNSIYSTASALQANELAHAQIAENLAHLNVPGFRRNINVFESMLKSDPDNPDALTGRELNGVQLAKNTTSFEAGGLRSTGRSLDVALSGDGFFSVQGPDGPLYTRNGSFQINAEGQLISSSNLLVNGEGGPIQIPTNVLVEQIAIAADGSISAGLLPLGKLEITSFADNSVLERAGTTLFRAGLDANPIPSKATVQQRSLELANTSAVNELIQMMVGSRHFESAQRAMRTISDAIQQNTSPRG